MDQPNLNYSSYLNSSNDFTKITPSDFNKLLNIDFSNLKAECEDYNTNIKANDKLFQEITSSKNKKLLELETHYAVLKKQINDEFDDAIKKMPIIDSSLYGTRTKVLDYVNEYKKYKSDTENVIKSFEVCSNALKNDKLNNDFISDLKEEKIKTYLERSHMVRGLNYCLKQESVPLDLNLKFEIGSKLFLEELSYSIPRKASAYESFTQYDDDVKPSGNSEVRLTVNYVEKADFTKPVPDTKLLSTEEQTYKTPYYDINTTYQPIVVPDKIGERMVESRGSLLESDYRLSSTDYWLLQTELKLV